MVSNDLHILSLALCKKQLLVSDPFRTLVAVVIYQSFIHLKPTSRTLTSYAGKIVDSSISINVQISRWPADQ